MPRDQRYMTIVHHQNSLFRAFLAVFVGYSPRFLGPERISMPRDTRDTTVVAFSKLMISDISGRFVG